MLHHLYRATVASGSGVDELVDEIATFGSLISLSVRLAKRTRAFPFVLSTKIKQRLSGAHLLIASIYQNFGPTYSSDCQGNDLTRLRWPCVCPLSSTALILVYFKSVRGTHMALWTGAFLDNDYN